MSLASLLPYDHPYAGGYPRLGGQPLPTDPDAIDYLSRVAAADGAAVEVGVAMAVDDFFKELKATPGLFEAIKASCILCGARTLAGALVPVVGDAPTNVANGFVSGDYSRTAGLTGDGTSYLNSGRANNADPQDDKHVAVYASTVSSTSTAYAGAGVSADTAFYRSTSDIVGKVNRNSPVTTVAGAGGEAGLIAVNRPDSATMQARAGGSTVTESLDANTYVSDNSAIFGRLAAGSVYDRSNATIAFYSIGTSLSLEALDTAVSNLITAIGNAL